MTRVVRRDEESFENLLRRFSKEVSKARILSAVRRKRHFIPKSEQKRVAMRKAIRREHQRQRREKRGYGWR